MTPAKYNKAIFSLSNLVGVNPENKLNGEGRFHARFRLRFICMGRKNS